MRKRASRRSINRSVRTPKSKETRWEIVAAFAAFVIVLAIGFSYNPQTTGFVTGSSSYHNYCADSDGGVNYFLKGTTRQGNVMGRDHCYTADNGKEYVKEFYCQGNQVLWEFAYCKYGCFNGACN